jgi:hypothetical protein
MAVRHRLAQGFGRLIRSAEDRGAFVLLGAAVPSRLLSAFPAAVPIERVPLDVASARIRDFLGGDKSGDCPPAGGPLGDAAGMGAVDPA